MIVDARASHHEEVCQYGTVHASCRCPGPKITHKIVCPTREECQQRMAETEQQDSPKVEYRTIAIPSGDVVEVSACSLCGMMVWDQQVHTEWHFPTLRCASPGCERTDDLKMSGPLGEVCPDHFREP